jgi:hypothetical protein
MSRVWIGAGLLGACGAFAWLLVTSGPDIEAAIAGPSLAPPAVSAGDAWRWAAAAPGLNIYIANYGRRPREEARVSVWVRREFFRNPAGIDANLIEAREFDCLHERSRRLARASEDGSADGDDRWGVSAAVSAWMPVTAGSTGDAVLHMVCRH